MSTATLTSLAILKVKIDEGGDYLDYLRPFVLQVLFDSCPDEVSDEHVARLIREHYGLVIPTRTIQVVLRRLAKSKLLKRYYGRYIPNRIADPGIHAKRAAAVRRTKATINGLIQYASETVQVSLDEEEATNAICSFLSHFDVSCLRAYLRNTAIPEISDSHGRKATLVSKYVMHIRKDAHDLFDNFMVVVQGHMLANALLCPDLAGPTTYRDVIFYLDTPLMVRVLGLEGQGKYDATVELIRLLRLLGGKIATFSHLRDELDRVLRSAADHIDDVGSKSGIVMEARRRKTTKSDLLLIATTADDRLAKVGLNVEYTPRYAAKFQIDEKAFESVLDDEVSYFNPRAKTFDVNSVRSIYALRKGTSSRSIERCRAILVTSNKGFARAAWQYGQTEEVSKDVSSVIDDVSLANIAWLQRPMDATSLPIAEVMAYCYAAAQPTTKLIDRILREVEKLRSSGKVSEREHRLLRSSQAVYDQLMGLTLGDETALTQESVLEALERVINEIRDEQAVELSAERVAHAETQAKLDASDVMLKKIRDENYCRCMRNAKWVTIVVLGVPSALVVAGGLASSSQVGYWIAEIVGTQLLKAGSYLHFAVSTVSLLFGVGLLGFYRRIYLHLLRWLAGREGLLDDGEFRGRLEANAKRQRGTTH